MQLTAGSNTDEPQPCVTLAQPQPRPSTTMNILIRAIITGFGLRIGSEIGKFVAKRVLPQDEGKSTEDEEEDSVGPVDADPPEV